jgi:hypothetical protein
VVRESADYFLLVVGAKNFDCSEINKVSLRQICNVVTFESQHEHGARIHYPGLLMGFVNVCLDLQVASSGANTRHSSRSGSGM